MAEQLAAIGRITAETAPPTFANTIAAMERSDRVLKQVQSLYGVWSTSMNTPEFQAVEREMAPRLAAFRDQVTQNEALFERIAAVYEARESAGLTPEQKRLAWLYYTTFARTGAKLDPAGKKRLSEINQRLATLYTSFAQNVLADETDHVLFLEGERDLARAPRLGPRRRRRRRRVAREEGAVGHPQHALEHGALPDVLGEAGPARACVADLLQPRRQRRREGQQQGDHRDPGAAGRALEAPRLRQLRALEPRGHDGEDAGAGHGAHGGGLDAGRRARPGGGRRDAGDRRRRGRRDHGSRPGTTATTRRRCARRSTTSTRTR